MNALSKSVGSFTIGQILKDLRHAFQTWHPSRKTASHESSPFSIPTLLSNPPKKRQVGFKFRVLLGLGQPAHSLSKRRLHVVHSILILLKIRCLDSSRGRFPSCQVKVRGCTPFFQFQLEMIGMSSHNKTYYRSWEKSLCCCPVGPSQSQHLGWFCYLTHQVSQVSYGFLQPSHQRYWVSKIATWEN